MPNPDIPIGQGVIDRIPTVLRAASPAGATVSVTGFEQLQSTAGGGGGGPSTFVETLIGGLGALVILALVFGSALAVVPLLMAIPAILTSFLLVGGLQQLTSVSFLVEYLVALIGLGVAIDYSLLVVTRWREERERGLENEAAILAAGATAGHAVVLSGLTVAVGLLSLFVLPVPFLRSIGYGGMLIPLVALTAAITLLPVTLAAWGPALDRHRVRRSSTTFSRGWERWGQLVVRRRWIAGAAGLAVIVALAVPALSMNTGQPSTIGVPDEHAGGQGAAGPRTARACRAPSSSRSRSSPTAARPAPPESRRSPTRRPASTPSLAPASPSFRQGSDALVERDPALSRATRPRARR